MKTLKIDVTYRDDATHPLRTSLVDSETGARRTQDVMHRDMLQVISYYNGFLDSLRVAGVHTLKLRSYGWPFVEEEYQVPHQFERIVAADTPKNLQTI